MYLYLIILDSEIASSFILVEEWEKHHIERPINRDQIPSPCCVNCSFPSHLPTSNQTKPTLEMYRTQKSSSSFTPLVLLLEVTTVIKVKYICIRNHFTYCTSMELFDLELFSCKYVEIYLIF